jgi:ABC-type dipeptide/oligopeptide/nickel transport system permease component
VVAVAAAMALTSQRGLDYSNPPPGCAFTWKTCDDPAPALGPLGDLHLGDFFEQQPFMGPLTLIARAPAVAIAEAAGGGVTAQYRWGALVCLLILGAYAFYGRYQRSAMLDVLGSDFLRTAQAKGLRRTKALIKHALRTALIPMGTFFAYEFALLFVGATFTEKIFGWHGMGEFLVQTIQSNDVNGTAGVALFVAVLVLIAGFMSDLVTAALDPRIRRG